MMLYLLYFLSVLVVKFKADDDILLMELRKNTTIETDRKDINLYKDFNLSLDPEFEDWTEDNVTNIWEYSGLYEGDILRYDFEGRMLKVPAQHWPDGVVPFALAQKDFLIDDILEILENMKKFHTVANVSFRPKLPSDQNWIDIRGDYPGCWSAIGMAFPGQPVNLGPKCLINGVIQHELLHVLGFYHQHSAVDRDKYIEIIWDNVKTNYKINLEKFDDNKAQDYGVEYDYESIMHYSRKAFSKNGNDTIRSRGNIDIPQQGELSPKDIRKLQKVYGQVGAQPRNHESFEKFHSAYKQILEIED